MKKKLKSLRKLWIPFTHSVAGAYASAACYYLLLSVPPSYMLAVTILPLLSVSQSGVISFLSVIVPASLLPIAEAIIHNAYLNPSPGLFSLSFIVAIWSAAKGISSLLEGFHAVLNMPKRNFIRRRFWGILFLITVSLIIFAVIVLLSAAYFILSAASRFLLPESPVWNVILRYRSIFSFVLLAVTFSCIYRIVCKEARIRFILLTGVLVSAAWILISAILSVYAQYGISRNSDYSGTGLIFVAMIWMRMVILALLYGAILCKLLSDDTYHPVSILKDVFPKSENR